MARVTQVQLDNDTNMLRADALNLDAQLWEHTPTGEYFIYIPSTERVRRFSHDGHRDFEDVLRAIHDRMLLRDIINELPILPPAKQALRNRLHRGILGPEADLPS